MSKLTDIQRLVLSKAVARDDGAAIVPGQMTKAAAAKVGSSLVARKLLRELRTKPGMPVWREAADGRSISLIITRAGRDAVGVDNPAELTGAAKTDHKVVGTGPAAGAPREGSKQALIIELLSKRSGATLASLIAATGWLPHTTRAALTGLRKRGFAIERIRSVGKESVYRIGGQSKQRILGRTDAPRDQGLALPDHRPSERLGPDLTA
jgi:Protein of unknown function (DUF3489)